MNETACNKTKTERLMDIVRQFPVEASVLDIRKEAEAVGFGKVDPSMLKRVRDLLWPGRRRQGSHDGAGDATKRQKIISLVARLGKSALTKDIIATGKAEGIELISGADLHQARSTVWPDRERIRTDPTKILTANPAVDGNVFCPYCESIFSFSRGEILLKRGLRTRRECSDCGGIFHSIEERGKVRKKCDARLLAMITVSEKRCTKCTQTLPIESFPLIKGGRKRNTRCRECRNKERCDRQLKSSLEKYGITSEQYILMLSEQGGGCKICKKTNTRSDRANHAPLVFDHCHLTGKFRGLICDRCNRSLGLFRDDLSVLESAVAYIKASLEG